MSLTITPVGSAGGETPLGDSGRRFVRARHHGTELVPRARVGQGLDISGGFSRASVERYLQGAASARAELEATLDRARSRLEAATEAMRRLHALECHVGEWIVLDTAHRHWGAGDGPDRPATPPPRPMGQFEELEHHLEHLRALLTSPRGSRAAGATGAC